MTTVRGWLAGIVRAGLTDIERRGIAALALRDTFARLEAREASTTNTNPNEQGNPMAIDQARQNLDQQVKATIATAQHAGEKIKAHLATITALQAQNAALSQQLAAANAARDAAVRQVADSEGQINQLIASLKAATDPLAQASK